MFKNKKLVSVAAILVIIGLVVLGFAVVRQPAQNATYQTNYRGVTFTYPADWQLTNKQLHTDSTHTVPSVGIHTKDSAYYVLATAKSTGQVVQQAGVQSEVLLVSATRLAGIPNTFDLRWIVHTFGTNLSQYSSQEFLMSSAQYSRLHWSVTKATPSVAGESPAFALPDGIELTVGTNSRDIYNSPQAAKAWFFTTDGKQAHKILLSAKLAAKK